MPEIMVLHIETRGASSPRVVELPWNSVRIGRSAQCEIRLNDPAIAEVECVLRYRGETWYVQPLGANGCVSIDGRPVAHLRVLPAGVSLRVGENLLTLRGENQAVAAFGSYETPIPVGSLPSLGSVETATGRKRLSDRYPRLRSSDPSQDTWPRSGRTPESGNARVWEARWRSALAERQARTESPTFEVITAPEESDEAPLSIETETWNPLDLATVEGTAAAPASPEAIVCETTPASVFESLAPINTEEITLSPPIETAHAIEAAAPAPKPSPSPQIIEPSRHVIDPEPPRYEASVLPEIEDLEWPSARVILAMRSRMSDQPPSAVASAVRPSRFPVPTESREPDRWSPSMRFALAPCAAAILGIAFVCTSLSWQWGEDSREAGVIADQVLRSGGPGPEGAAGAVVSTDASWWKTTSGHLGLKAAALGSSPQGDPERAEQIRFLLGAARNASPLDPSTRLARIQHGTTADDPLATLGLSRDTVSLAVTARKLAREGKTGASLRAYRKALEIAAEAEIARGRVPLYLDDRTPGRFALPNEELILGVVREMASQTDWTFAKWSEALPDHALVLLATYRVLQERNQPEAEALLDRLAVLSNDKSSVLETAARAEGLALKSQFAAAAEQYREAIARVDDETVRRTWWLNLAEILAKSGDHEKIKDVLSVARAGRGDDAIGVLVGQALAREELASKPTQSSSTQGLRAN